MANDIKGLLDSIINDTNNSYPGRPGGEDTSVNNMTTATGHSNPVRFDKGQFREKLSMFVLKDIVCAMMHDETENLDDMIDRSIERHMHDNYHGSCYGYLTHARDKLKSPLLGDIIQEIDSKTNEVADTISKKKDPEVADKVNVKDILKDVDNYDELRERLKKQVSEQVVADVTKVITSGNDAPVFDDLDEKLTDKKKTDDVTSESVILRMCGAIVTESAMEGHQMSTDEGINQAIVEYCISELDALFKQNPKVSIYAKYLKK